MSFITQLYYYVLLILYTKRKKSKKPQTKRKKKSNSKIGSKLPIVYIIVKSKKVDFEGNNIVHFDTEIKNLILYKKALFNANFASENDLLKILNPIINSKSIWKSHALYLLAEFFYSKNEKQKAKEFFNQILVLPNSNSVIKVESQKRLNRDLGE